MIARVPRSPRRGLEHGPPDFVQASPATTQIPVILYAKRATRAGQYQLFGVHLQVSDPY